MNSPHYHIAHILPFPSLGGTEVSTLRIAQGLRGDPFEHTAFCLAGAPANKLFADAGFETASFEAVQPSYRHPRAFLSASFRLAREFKRRRISLVHGADVLAAHFTAFAGRLAGLPVVCHVRNRYDQISRRDRSFLRPVSRFIFVSRDAWAKFAVKVSDGRGALVYDGIDLVEVDREEARASVRREFDLPDNARIIGMVARVAPQKDYFTLARAAERVVAARPDARFLIVGDHSHGELNRRHYAEVAGMLADRGLARWFTFTGHRPDAPRLIAAFDLFALCTHTEGFGLVIAEAMAQSIPVIATNVAGTPEIVAHGQTGLLHEHEDDAQLAEQMLGLLADEALAARLGQAGARFVRSNFGYQRFMAEMAGQYRAVIEGRDRPATESRFNGALKVSEGGPVR